MHPKELLQRHQLQPKKSLGQNFLFDENVLRRIVEAAAITSADPILEIGPGLGSLTRLLATAGGKVVAVELDDNLLPILREQLADAANVTLVQGDILAQDPAAWFPQPYKVVANVPYYITGAILRHLLGAALKPSLMVLTVQKEVADRITAKPPNMSLLAVSVQCYGHVRHVAKIKAGSFWPVPEVDSAVVRITLDASPMTPAFEKAFFRLVRAGFSQRRKQLHNNLKQLGLGSEPLAQLLRAAAIDGRRRAQTLTVPEWHALTRSWLTITA